MPVHWGTFSLAMHAWDQPAEAILDLGQKAGVPLLMPRLGEAVEPVHVGKVEAWWRRVDVDVRTAKVDAPVETTLPL